MNDLIFLCIALVIIIILFFIIQKNKKVTNRVYEDFNGMKMRRDNDDSNLAISCLIVLIGLVMIFYYIFFGR